MVCLYFCRCPSEKGEMYLSLRRVPFRCRQEYPFHAVSPKYQRSPVQSVEQFSLQQSGQFLQLLFGIEGDAFTPVKIFAFLL